MSSLEASWSVLSHKLALLMVHTVVLTSRWSKTGESSGVTWRTIMFLFFSYINAPLALPVIALTPASVPLCLSMTLPSVIGSVLALLTEGSFSFPLCMLRPTREEMVASSSAL